MPLQFNSYIDNIGTDFWQNLCKSRGQLRHYDKGEAFIMAGEVGRYRLAAEHYSYTPQPPSQKKIIV